jgi:hypothetical protein
MLMNNKVEIFVKYRTDSSVFSASVVAARNSASSWSARAIAFSVSVFSDCIFFLIASIVQD